MSENETLNPQVAPVADYPAAHSMDTDWFAVDADGYVATFSTGEAGIMPDIITTDQDVAYQMRPALLAAGVPYDISDVLANPPANSMMSAEKRKYDTAWSCLFVASSQQSVDMIVKETEKTKSPAIALNCPPGQFALWLEEIPTKLLARFIEQGWLTDAWSFHEMDWERIGIFSYSNDDYGLGEPYTRAPVVPTKPLKFDELPEGLRSLVQVRFLDLKFSESTEIWPRRYYRCFGWGDSDE